jgi:hypothetical protein
MKRSFLMSLASTLVLSVAVSAAVGMAACGGTGTGGDTTTAGGGDSDGGTSGGGDTSSTGDDPVAACQKISDDIQKDVDALITPITGAADVIGGVVSLKTDVKPTGKTKLDWKKLMVEVQKVVNGADADIASLQLDADSTAKITDRVTKLKVLITATKNYDQAAKDLGQKIVDGVPKIVKLAGPAIAKAELTLKNPFAKAADKADAQATKDKLGGLGDAFKAKVTKWQSDLAGLPAALKDIPKKLAALK